MELVLAVILALTVAWAFAACPAHAADVVGQTAEHADGGANAKKLALIRILSRSGKNEEAAAGMRSLYPEVPPEGELALEYYRIIGKSAKGWNEGRAGLEKLVKANPDDARYQFALAQHLTTHPETRRAGIKALAALASSMATDMKKQPGIDRQKVLDAWQGTLAALDHSPDNIGLFREYLALDPGNSTLRNALDAAQKNEAERRPWLLRDKADALLQQGHPEQAMDTLKEALQLAPANPWVRFDLSRLYHKQGDQKRGRALMMEGLSVAPDDPDTLYACALFLGLRDEADNALRLLDKIPAAKQMPPMRRLQKRMEIQSQTQQAKALAQNGRHSDAIVMLEHAGSAAGKDAELVNDVANAWLDIGETSRGAALLKRLLAKSPTMDLRLRYATLLNRMEQDKELAPLLNQLDSSKELSDKDKGDVRYLQAALAARQADNLRHTGNYAAARAALAPALKRDPENPDLLMALARVHISANEPQRARDIYQQILRRDPGNAGARQALDNMTGDKNPAETADAPADNPSGRDRQRASGYVTTGVDYLDKPGGTPGISNLTTTEIPVELRVPVGYDGGQVFFKLDPVTTDAGALQLADLYNLRQYGKVLALAPAGIASASAQSANGTALAAGYEGNGIRADIGTSPLGFPVSDVLGGIKWSHYTETSGFSFDLSRRPITSSLLSYAGAYDPVSGEVWGGVRSSGASLHVSRDSGPLGGFVDLGYYRLTGKNVLSNTEYALRAGFDLSFINEEDSRLTAGLAFTDWHYSENLRYYTFGHGGYYSPQKYYSFSIPLRWTGRKERWSYLLQGSVSASASYEKDMPFYPTSAALQAQGIANSATMTPVYTGGNSHGTGWSLGGALERQLAPQLFGGFRLQIDRSDYYTPNFAILYLRYLFDAHTGAVSYPPEPVKAYSRF